MHVGTQTPRKFYSSEADDVLQAFIVKLKALEKKLLERQKKESTILQEAIVPYANENCHNIQIGPNGTTLSRQTYGQIDWSCAKKAIRDLCHMIFGLETLGTHTLTGRVGPGAVMHNRKPKAQLKPHIVVDILDHIMGRFSVNQLQVLDGIRRVCRNSARTLLRGQS
ncbi:hypothetical protein KR222_007807, partial [Zaprionus bogoriensis]